MPPVSQSPAGTTSQGSILLIEEYDALAAAITSALKKFAPAHVTHVARSLAEAKTLSKKIEPDLFVIDFDPAFPGLSPFLQKMQQAHPEAKALIIAGNIPDEITAESRSVGALQFVGKPFDVPDFGAAVQALLGPWTEPRGNLHSLGLADLVLAQCAGQRTVALEIKNEAGKSGEIQMREGRLSHAETGKKSGPDALRAMLAWSEIEVREREKPRAVRRNVEANWTEALIDAFRDAKTRQLKSPETAPAQKRTGKKIVVVDDTEMLLIFVEDVLMTADPGFQITTALNGADGVEEIRRIKPDLVLLDYSLPDFNGDEVCRRLLQNEATAKIPVLMMSGHVLEMAKAAAVLDNVVSTIAKPFLSDALIHLVHQILTEPRTPRKKTAPSRRVAETKAPTAPFAKQPSETEKLPVKDRGVPAPPPVPSPPPVERLAQEPPPPPIQAQPPMPPEVTQPAPQLKPPEPELQHPFPFAAAPEITLQPKQPADQARRPVPPSPEPPRRGPFLPPLRKQPQQVGGKPSEPLIITAPVVSNGSNKVILGLFLDVVSVQLTPELRMGSIRAKPSSREVSLHVASPTMRATLSEIGFQLGPVGLDEHGRITTVRLIPSLAPFKAAPTQSALQIGGISVVPVNSVKQMQLTPAPHSSMTMHMLASLELAGVELSNTFQIAQLVLKNRTNTVRVTLKSQAAGQEETGTKCETLSVRLDHSAQIAELLLNPIR